MQLTTFSCEVDGFDPLGLQLTMGPGKCVQGRVLYRVHPIPSQSRLLPSSLGPSKKEKNIS